MSLATSIRSWLSMFTSSSFLNSSPNKEKHREDVESPFSEATCNGLFPLCSPGNALLDPIGVRFFHRNPTVKMYTFPEHDFRDKTQVELSIPMAANSYDTTAFNVFLFHEEDWYSTPGYGPRRRTFYRSFHRYAPGRARIFVNTLQDSGHGDRFSRIKVFVFQQVFPNSHKDNALNTLNYDALVEQVESIPREC